MGTLRRKASYGLAGVGVYIVDQDQHIQRRDAPVPVGVPRPIGIVPSPLGSWHRPKLAAAERMAGDKEDAVADDQKIPG
jgi:hypothetical protein